MNREHIILYILSVALVFYWISGITTLVERQQNASVLRAMIESKQQFCWNQITLLPVKCN